MIDCDIDGEIAGDPRIIEAKELSQSDWEPPEGLTLAAVTKFNCHKLPLNVALNILAFGANDSKIYLENNDRLTQIALKTRAWRHLWKAGRSGCVHLYKSGSKATRINAKFFDAEYSLVADEDNAIEPDIGYLTNNQFSALFSDRPRNQIHGVSVNTETFCKWLGEQLPTTNLERKLKISLQEAINKKDSPITQSEAQEIASKLGVKPAQKKSRLVLKELQGQQKPGPRGPRKKKIIASNHDVI